MKLGETNPLGVIDDHRYLTDVENKDGPGCYSVKEQLQITVQGGEYERTNVLWAHCAKLPQGFGMLVSLWSLTDLDTIK